MGKLEDWVKSAKDWYNSKTYWAAILFLVNMLLKNFGIDVDAVAVVDGVFTTAETIATTAETGFGGVIETITKVLDALWGFLALIGIRDAIKPDVKGFFSIGGQGGKDPE